MAERLARVEAKVDSLKSDLSALKSDVSQFVRTASSPEIGFVSAALLKLFKGQLDKDVTDAKDRADYVQTQITRRLDEINADHDHRITRLEDARTRLAYALAGVSGGLVVDILVHVLVGAKV